MSQPNKSMGEIQRDNPGLWVAVRDGQVVEAQPTAHALMEKLSYRGITGARVFRCPEIGEPELVGLG